MTSGSTVTWADSHCHLTGLDESADDVIDRARAVGVEVMVCVGTDLASSRDAVALAQRQPEVFAAVGLHPHDASRWESEGAELEGLLGESGVVAVGECGLDYYYGHSPADAQQAAFRAQIRLALDRDLPLVIHTRDAWPETFVILRDVGVPRRTIFHCFTGDADVAREALDLGAYLSFSGIVSFKNAADLREAAAIAPLDRVLVETDTPYLAPVPHRGRENRPEFLPDVGAALAAAMGRSVDEVARATLATTRAVLTDIHSL
ncbi:MAG: hydrolase, TatD family [Actinomycetia bacterium]|nr:hydrolase, TatD family [Actinomycetes bacterium]